MRVFLIYNIRDYDGKSKLVKIKLTDEKYRGNGFITKIGKIQIYSYSTPAYGEKILFLPGDSRKYDNLDVIIPNNILKRLCKTVAYFSVEEL